MSDITIQVNQLQGLLISSLGNYVIRRLELVQRLNDENDLANYYFTLNQSHNFVSQSSLAYQSDFPNVSLFLDAVLEFLTLLIMKARSDDFASLLIGNILEIKALINQSRFLL